MNELSQKRLEAITALSQAVMELGERYREAQALANDIAHCIHPDDLFRAKFPLAMGADAFQKQVVQAINAAMVGKYGEPNQPNIMVTGPLGEIHDTSLLTAQAENDAKNLEGLL